MSNVSEPATVTPAQAAAAIADGAVLVDVRSAGGRAANGAIPGAIVADRDALDTEFALGSGVGHPQIVSLDQPIVVVCGSVNGSGPVARGLLERGFVDVVHIEGGFPAWREAGLPTEAPTADGN
ncbi:rhodanese-like domain-containing protein [Nocardia bovistercoris]|uniref:Sulfurtransferase n=1 Tax=Nocardia bovistercoris TaxID=2785916 RepID=A0A931IK94_9NOCA|nr:rhodanese-like domain-containing protein [Nocardia bovistercoris]MBH0781180.1 sulfurtransferase [Nocardia bovistercoris]